MSFDKTKGITNLQNWFANRDVIFIGHDGVKVWFGVVEDNDGPIDPPIVSSVRLLTDAELRRIRHRKHFVPALSAAGD